jgi:hypothetical protein
MNTTQPLFHIDRIMPTLVKFGSIVILGISIGVVSTLYSPIFPLVGTALFTLAAIGIYINSQYRHAYRDVTATQEISLLETKKAGFLFYLFYCSFFLSITIPKSGRTIAGVPVTIANLCILLTLVWWLVSLLFSPKSLSKIPVLKPIFLFIIYGMIAGLIGLLLQNLRRSVVLDFVAFIGFIPLYFLVCHVARTEKEIQKMVWVVVVSICLVCLYGVLQTRLGFERMAIPGITEQYGKVMYQGVGRWNIIEGGATKVYSTFQNGNIFGNHLATFVPFIGGVLIGLPRSKKRMIGIGIFLLSCYVLILTYSRGALVGTASGFFVLAVLFKKIRLRAIVVLLLVVTICAVFFYQYADRPELVRYDIRRIVTEPDRFSAGRFERANQVLLGFYNFPLSEKLFGAGFGGVLISPLGWYFSYADNLYLTLLFKMGIVGIILLGVMLIQLFLSLLRLRARVQNVYWQGLINGGIAGLFASLVHNLADTLWFFPPLSANFWFLAGITMASAIIATRVAGSTEQVEPTKPSVTKRSSQFSRQKVGVGIVTMK